MNIVYYFNPEDIVSHLVSYSLGIENKNGEEDDPSTGSITNPGDYE
jgi:hypothetical protein